MKALRLGLKKLNFLFVIGSTKPTAVFCGVVCVCNGCGKTDLTVPGTKRRMKRGLLRLEVYYTETLLTHICVSSTETVLPILYYIILYYIILYYIILYYNYYIETTTLYYIETTVYSYVTIYGFK